MSPSLILRSSGGFHAARSMSSCMCTWILMFLHESQAEFETDVFHLLTYICCGQQVGCPHSSAGMHHQGSWGDPGYLNSDRAGCQVCCGPHWPLEASQRPWGATKFHFFTKGFCVSGLRATACLHPPWSHRSCPGAFVVCFILRSLCFQMSDMNNRAVVTVRNLVGSISMKRRKQKLSTWLEQKPLWAADRRAFTSRTIWLQYSLAPSSLSLTPISLSSPPHWDQQ